MVQPHDAGRQGKNTFPQGDGLTREAVRALGSIFGALASSRRSLEESVRAAEGAPLHVYMSLSPVLEEELRRVRDLERGVRTLSALEVAFSHPPSEETPPCEA